MYQIFWILSVPAAFQFCLPTISFYFQTHLCIGPPWQLLFLFIFYLYSSILFFFVCCRRFPDVSPQRSDVFSIWLKFALYFFDFRHYDFYKTFFGCFETSGYLSYFCKPLYTFAVCLRILQAFLFPNLLFTLLSYCQRLCIVLLRENPHFLYCQINFKPETYFPCWYFSK